VTISGLPPSVFLKLNVGKVSYLSQNYVLDEGSIRFNITNKNTSENEDRKLWEILKIVDLHDFVNTLPENLEYLVGQHNSKISGGQKQKIGLAKALYKDPEILILDEATNSIDSKSETIILNNILNLNYKQTLIYISHNLRTHEMFEKVFYINSTK
jgi:ATP-binding cassette subfamily C protein